MSWSTKVHLYKNVPFSLNQENTRWFTSKAQQNNYFDSLPSTTLSTEGRYVKINEGEILVNRLKDTMDVYNYMVITNNNTYDNSVRTYYCFVEETEHVSTSATKVKFRVDVLQTFMFDIDFKKSFIDRQHSKDYITGNKPVKNVAPESINLGSEYETVKSYTMDRDVDRWFDTLLVTASSPLSSSNIALISANTISGIATPLTQYLILVPKNFSESVIPKVTYVAPDGTHTLFDSDMGDMGDYLGIFKAFNSEEHANKIVSINYLPFFPFDVNVSGGSTAYELTDPYPVNSRKVQPFSILGGTYKALVVLSSRGVTLQNTIQANLYDDLKNYMSSQGLKSSKLMMYPFARAVLYDNLGNSFEVKPQYLNENGLINIDAMTSISSSPKIGYTVKGLKQSKYNTTLVSNINADVEIVNDHTATYMQGRKNSDRVAYTQGVVGGFTQMAGALAIGGISAATVNPMGVAMAGTMLLGGGQNAHNTISTLTAKQEDVKNLPPSLIGQAGGANLAIGYDMIKPRLEIQMLGLENLKIIDSYFHLYGVSQHRLLQPNITSRTHYNFIKTAGANITGSVPTLYLSQIKAIFDAGVTLWHTNDMYNYDVSNNER